MIGRLPPDVTEALLDYIETLSVREEYQQSTADAWRRALVPLSIQTTPSPATSLTFSILDRERRYECVEERGAIRYRTDLSIQVLYLCRPHDASADWRRIDLALHDLLCHLLHPTSSWPTGVDVLDDPGAIGYRRDATTVRDVLLGEVRVPVSFLSPLYRS